jgi:uncharacterized membrane protein YsdA (DUF1294 family)
MMQQAPLSITNTAGTALLVWYGLFSIFAFALYLSDKSAAKGGRWRTRESTLHLVALLGGWPGSMLARKLIRHKSRKPGFRYVFWLTVITNVSVMGAILSNR